MTPLGLYPMRPFPQVGCIWPKVSKNEDRNWKMFTTSDTVMTPATKNDKRAHSDRKITGTYQKPPLHTIRYMRIENNHRGR